MDTPAAATQIVTRPRHRMRWNVSLVVGAVLTGIFLVVAIASFVHLPANPNIPDIRHRLLPPGSAGHLLGTDVLGRDIVAQLMVGTRTSLIVGAGAAVFSLILGTITGLAAAAAGNIVDEVISRGADILLSIPGMVTALVLAATLGSGVLTTILALTAFFTPSFTRVSRSAALGVLQEDFITAAQLYGRNKLFILVRHVLPNVAGVMIVQFTLYFAAGILVEAGLSYLGVGVNRPQISWGLMLNEAQNQVGISSPLAVWPGLAIVFVVLGLNLLGDGLRDVLDPKLSREKLMAAGNALVVSDLVVRNSDLAAVRGVSFTIPAGGRMGLVGESGSGKTLTALAVMGLLPMGWHAEGQVLHDGADLVTESDRALSQRRGRTLSMVFQDPLSALDPVRSVGVQISSVIRRHTKANRAEAARQTLELVRQMNLPRPEQIVRAYPHELSGGQRQRIMIAMSLACYPQLIIADEPTTALDVTVQKQVLRLLNGAVRDRGCALLMITHDLPIIAAMCDTVAVMYAGRIIEMGPVGEVFRYPRHHYTRGLLDSQPTMDNIALDGSSRLVSIPGMVPPLTSLPTGCAFHPRCPAATEKCRATLPELDGETRKAACWHPLAVAQKVAVSP